MTELPQLLDTREFATARKELSCNPAATSARDVPLTVRGTLNVMAGTPVAELTQQRQSQAESLSSDDQESLAKKSMARSGGRPNQLENTGIRLAPLEPGPS
jgi:hypothetical protein